MIQQIATRWHWSLDKLATLLPTCKVGFRCLKGGGCLGCLSFPLVFIHRPPPPAHKVIESFLFSNFSLCPKQTLRSGTCENPLAESWSVVSDSVWPHGWHSPWNSPGKNTGVGSLSLLQGIFPAQGLNPALLDCRRILYQQSHKGSPRILEWVAFSSRSSQSGNQTGVSCIAGGFFTNLAIKEAHSHWTGGTLQTLDSTWGSHHRNCFLGNSHWDVKHILDPYPQKSSADKRVQKSL